MDERILSKVNSPMDMQDRTAIVTGGSRGVGRATALLLARAGASVGIGYQSRAEAADEVVGEIRALGAAGWCEQGDLSKPEGAAALADRTASEFQWLDYLVVNHGIWPVPDVPIQEMDPERWARTLAVNLDSVFHTLGAMIPLMKDEGAIVLVTSTAGQRGEAFHADYAATKGAMISMVKGLSGELAGRGIRVNSVAPGWIDTEMASPAFDSGRRAEIERSIPLGRIASADDVAGPIVFLCSELARHVTGEILNVNGGAVLVG